MLHIYDGLNYLRDELEHRGNTLRGLYNQQSNALKDRTIIWVWEGKGGNSRRRKVYPDYKGTRPQAPENIFAAVKLFQQLLDLANVFQIHVDGYEGDDVVASLIHRYKETPKFLYSTDKDFRPLYGEEFKLQGLANPIKECPDKYVRLYKTLVGDPSDNIKGIPGLGIKQFNELDHDALMDIFENRRKNLLPTFLSPIKAKPYEWAMTHIDELFNMWDITGYYLIDHQVLDSQLRVGQCNFELANAFLKRYLQ